VKDVPEMCFERFSYVFSRPDTKQGKLDLRADLYLPDNSTGPWPLVVWVHAGGFRAGTRRNRKHGLIAETLAREGYAMACIDYRLARPPAVLTAPARRAMGALIRDSEKWGEEMQEPFRRQRPIAVVEDICAFFKWINKRLEHFNLTGEFVLGGSSAGGISVFNAIMLHDVIGQPLPTIRTGLVLSGGFAYPSFWRPTDTRFLAIHNPNDAHVPFSSVARINELAGDQLDLIAAPEQPHGSPCLSPAEPLPVAVRRLVAFDQRQSFEEA
jgi:dienelactone hydrolase